MLIVVMLRIGIYYCYAECHYAECRYAECLGAVKTACLGESKLVKLKAS